MVVRVCEQAAQSGAASVAVATDDERIVAAVQASGFGAHRTRADHSTGTDRIAEAAEQLALADGEIVVNVQGDEPLIEPQVIRDVAAVLASHGEASMSTACHPIREAPLFESPHVVKVVLDAQGYALYFSRAGVPYPRDGQAPQGLRHIGIYAYRIAFLRRYADLAPAPLETIEQLEQLRVLWHGGRIAVAVVDESAAPGVDVPDDLDVVRRMWLERESRRRGASPCV